MWRPYKIIFFLLLLSSNLHAQYGITVTLKPATVGPTAATVNGSVSGLISYATKFDVLYGESATSLTKTKSSGVSFGPGVILLNGFTIGTTLDSLKQQTKYYYKYVTNDSYQGITNKSTAIDSFITTKEPFKVNLLNSQFNDTLAVASFISKLTTNDTGIPKNSLTVDASTGNKYFTVKNDSLFTAVKFDTLKSATYTIKIYSLFSDNSNATSTFTISVLDKTPPLITTKIDTLNVILGVSLSANVTPTDFNKSTIDNRSNVDLSLSKSNFDCANIGLNKIEFIAKDESLNTSIKFVYVNIKDTIKPTLYVLKEKTIYIDSLGKSLISSNDLETTSLIPDSLYTKNISARFLLEPGNVKNTVDTSKVLINSGATYTTDRFGANLNAMNFNGTNQFANLGTDAVKVTVANPYTISLWAKAAYTPTSLSNFGTFMDYNGHRYFKSNGTVTWKQAKAISDSLKGYLAIPNTAAENTFLRTLTGGSLTWMGVTDEVTEGKYRTVQGDSVTYFNWKAGQPDNFNDEDYIHLDANGQWNDGPNSYLLNFIIEFDINSGVFLSKYQNLDAGNSNFFLTPSSVSGNGTNSLTFTAPDSTWNHFVYVLSSGANNTKIYINGTLVKTGTVNYNSVHSTSTPVFLGRVSGSPSNFYTGSLDDLRVYNKILSDTQIIDLYNYEKLSPANRINQTGDNCSIAQKIISQSTFSCTDLGTKKIIYTVVDKSGNKVDSSINILVKDTTKPSIKIKNAIIRIDNIAPLKLAYKDFDDGSTDNCSIDTRLLSKSDFTLKDTGQNTFTYTVTDKSGNSKSTNATITLACKDPVAPSNQTIELCQSSTVKPLEASLPTGSTGSLQWYTTMSGGTANSNSPSPSTTAVAATEYYIAHLLNGCESTKRAKVSVIVKPLPVKATLSRDTTGFLNSSNKSLNVWLKDGVVLSDTLQKFKPLSQGSYQVRNTLNGCSIISDPYYFFITDVINLSASEFIKLSPNPYVNKVVFEFKINGYDKLNLDVYDFTTGSKLTSKQGLYSGTPIFLGQLSGGVYIVKAYSNDNKVAYQFKMIKL